MGYLPFRAGVLGNGGVHCRLQTGNKWIEVGGAGE
jgi:hypothetical protein